MPEGTERHASAIAARLSLRPPQRRSLEILDRICALAPPRKGTDSAAALAAIGAEFPEVRDFDRDFPSVCFALATGVGKTRLMGAFVAYLRLAHELSNFFVLAPGLTVYDKLVTDFTPNTPKYVLKGISEFAVSPPLVTTGDNYERHIAGGGSLFSITINVFNISKINAEIRGGRTPRIRSFREEIGASYFDYLAGLEDLVLIMDESHRYRATAGVRAINELKPVLGLELTATPFVEARPKPVWFRNVIYEYPLARAMEDGFVKEPAVVTRENFVMTGKSDIAIERIKLEDGIRLHEAVKVELETYARQFAQPAVKPFMLVIARDTTHAAELVSLVKSKAFFEGRYAQKVIQVDSSVRKEEAIQRLLRVERADEPTEIVVHVNMLKEGWDVTNLYTIVPLRAASARTLIEQSIGRGLRLPYGRRTGVEALDRLTIVAHDRFQEIVDEARRPDSVIRLRQIVLPDDGRSDAPGLHVSRPRLSAMLGLHTWEGVWTSGFDEEQAAFAPEERETARVACELMWGYETRPDQVPGVSSFLRSDVQAGIAREIERRMALAAKEGPPDLGGIVSRVARLLVEQTMDIPRILLVPRGGARSGYHPFALDLSGLRYEVPGDALWAEYLRTGSVARVGVAAEHREDRSLEDYVLDGLVAFNDISYEEHAELLHGLAGRVASHFLSYLPEDGARKVLQVHWKEIAALVHAQMQPHFWQEAPGGYDVRITRGFTALKERTYARPSDEALRDFREPPPDKASIGRHLFGGFERGLYGEEKFQSDPERRLALILDRDALKWFRPARGQFQIYYRSPKGEQEYQPDFVAEFGSRILMLEAKAAGEMRTPEVLAKRDAAVEWCRHASEHAKTYGGKPWDYGLVPHDVIVENMTIDGLMARAPRG